MNEDLTKYSGEEHYRKPPKLSLSTISLNGKEGVFYKTYQKDGEWAKEAIGVNLEGVILRVRRILFSMTDEERMYTNEHNHPGEVISLFSALRNGQPQLIDKGTSAQLREKYQKLKTQQILYFLTDGEMVKLTVRGASLGSKNKPEGSIPLYDYYNMFNSKEHLYEFVTKIVPKEEVGKLGTYYAMSFEKGEKVKEMDKVAESLKYLHDVFASQGAYYASRTTEEELPPLKPKLEVTKDEEGLPTINVDEEEGIKAEDLPF